MKLIAAPIRIRERWRERKKKSDRKNGNINKNCINNIDALSILNVIKCTLLYGMLRLMLCRWQNTSRTYWQIKLHKKHDEHTHTHQLVLEIVEQCFVPPFASPLTYRIQANIVFLGGLSNESAVVLNDNTLPHTFTWRESMGFAIN